MDSEIERTFFGAVSIRDSKNVTVHHQGGDHGGYAAALRGWERSLALREESITLRERSLLLLEETLQRWADSLAVWEASRQAIRDARHGVQVARAVGTKQADREASCGFAQLGSSGRRQGG